MAELVPRVTGSALVAPQPRITTANRDMENYAT